MKTRVILTVAALVAAFTVVSSAQLIGTSPPPPSEAELTAETLVAEINAEITRRIDVHRRCFDRLWRNPRGATPAAILEALGTRAGRLFQCSAENLLHLQRCAEIIGKTRADFIADVDCIPPVELVFHQDGTVTIAAD